MAQQFRLKWSNHMNNVLDVVKNLFSTESLVDVTLACDGMSIKAHKVILSACSPFFQTLLLENPCQHPIIIIPHMKFSDLKPLVDFMYEGEISVTRDQLASLTKNAQDLKIKGLAEISFEKTFSNESPMVADQGLTQPTESSSSVKQADDHMQEQCLNVLNCNNNNPSDKKTKSPSSNTGEFSRSILVNPIYHYEISQDNDSSQNFDFSESADVDNIQVDHSKSPDEIKVSDNLSIPRKEATPRKSKKNIPESNTDSFSDSSQISLAFEALEPDTQLESPTEVNAELIESDPSMSPGPGPSQDTEDSMMMDHSSNSSHPEVYNEDSANLEPVDSQPEGNSSVIRTICFSKDVPEEAKSSEEMSTSSKKWKYKCYKCNLLVASRGHLAIHMRTHTGERPFSCHVCGKTAIRQHDLQLHMRTHTGIKPYACPICGMKFNNSSNYRRHYKRRHPTAERVVQVCKLCDEQFDSKELLNGHLINQHSILNSHVCVVCQKSYKRQYDLKTHLRVHSKEKPYSCKVCFKLFSYKSNQIRHIRQHFKKPKNSPAAERQQTREDPDYIPESDT